MVKSWCGRHFKRQFSQVSLGMAAWRVFGAPEALKARGHLAPTLGRAEARVASDA
jgi:hypothetical protein